LFGAALAAATLVYALLLTGTELNVAAAHAFSANAELIVHKPMLLQQEPRQTK
jgi:hypothetical protein